MTNCPSFLWMRGFLGRGTFSVKILKFPGKSERLINLTKEGSRLAQEHGQAFLLDNGDSENGEEAACPGPQILLPVSMVGLGVVGLLRWWLLFLKGKEKAASCPKAQA